MRILRTTFSQSEFHGQTLSGTANEGTGSHLDFSNAGGLAALSAAKAAKLKLADVTENPPWNQGHPYRIYPGAPRVRLEGGSLRTPGTKEIRGKRMMAFLDQFRRLLTAPRTNF